jgi:hypothetical protein
MAQQLTQRKQQGWFHLSLNKKVRDVNKAGDLELQLQYTNYKNGLQQIAQKIGDVEQEAEEHSMSNLLSLRSEHIRASVLFNGTVPRFFLASFDPLSHRWKSPLTAIAYTQSSFLKPSNRFRLTGNASGW